MPPPKKEKGKEHHGAGGHGGHDHGHHGRPAPRKHRKDHHGGHAVCVCGKKDPHGHQPHERKNDCVIL